MFKLIKLGFVGLTALLPSSSTAPAALLQKAQQNMQHLHSLMTETKILLSGKTLTLTEIRDSKSLLRIQEREGQLSINYVIDKTTAYIQGNTPFYESYLHSTQSIATALAGHWYIVATGNQVTPVLNRFTGGFDFVLKSVSWGKVLPTSEVETSVRGFPTFRLLTNKHVAIYVDAHGTPYIRRITAVSTAASVIQDFSDFDLHMPIRIPHTSTSLMSQIQSLQASIPQPSGQALPPAGGATSPSTSGTTTTTSSSVAGG